MSLSFVKKENWIRADRRPYAAFSLEISIFEEVLDEQAPSYTEDLGPAKGFMCQIDEVQFYVWSLEDMDPEYKTTLDFPYPFINSDKLLEKIMKSVDIKPQKLSWVTKET